MVAADLQSGYYHVDIHEQDVEYLGFEYLGQYYVFTCLPFGLASAPYAFTLITRAMVKQWRARGVRTIHYLDDFLWLAPSRELCAQLSHHVCSDLERLGCLSTALKVASPRPRY
jgi:hypothetical protein